MYALADHRTTPSYKYPYDWVKFQYTLPQRPSKHAVLATIHGTLAYTPSHTRNDGQARRDRCAFEVLAFPSGIFG